MTDINSVFDELNQINEETTDETWYPGDEDRQAANWGDPWWMVTRAYADYVNPSEDRYKRALAADGSNKGSYRMRENAYAKAKANGRIPWVLINVLTNAAKYPNLYNRGNVGNVSRKEIIDMASECLLRLM